jgi:hypothetical protein
LVKQLGYKDSQIEFRKDIPVEKIALGSKSIKYRPDYLLSFDGKSRALAATNRPDGQIAQKRVKLLRQKYSDFQKLRISLFQNRLTR